jgi:hypothetical protein
VLDDVIALARSGTNNAFSRTLTLKPCDLERFLGLESTKKPEPGSVRAKGSDGHLQVVLEAEQA